MRKVIELNGRRLDLEHLDKNNKELYKWNTLENLTPLDMYIMKVKKYKEKEIKSINGKIKKLNETYEIKIRSAKKSKKKV